MQTSPEPKQATLSVVIPAHNECAGLDQLLPELRKYLADGAEIIVVNDGSDDETITLCSANAIKVISHPYKMGNGAAIKTGARAALGDTIVFMDADGQHKPEDIPHLLKKLAEGYDMAVGARRRISQAGFHRAVANGLYNWLASWMVGQKICDLTSGFRVVKADKFKRFLYLLPNGFSYPTTITMSFFRAGYSVAYVPIVAPKRIGKSHMQLIRDGVRFLLIIFKIGTLYSPLKLFLPISVMFAMLGISNYIYTFVTIHRFTNMSALLIITGVLVFLIGLISEQITALNYRDSDR